MAAHQTTLWHGLAIVIGSLAVGCDLPRDPEATLTRARGGVLRVGVMHHPPWTLVGEDGVPKEGVEVALVESLAKELDARIEWSVAGESLLMESLKKFELDLVVGGLSKSSAWEGKVGLTEAYLHVPFDPSASRGVGAQSVGHVFATPPGENAWLLRVEAFLRRKQADAELLFRRAAAARADKSIAPSIKGNSKSCR